MPTTTNCAEKRVFLRNNVRYDKPAVYFYGNNLRGNNSRIFIRPFFTFAKSLQKWQSRLCGVRCTLFYIGAPFNIEAFILCRRYARTLLQHFGHCHRLFYILFWTAQPSEIHFFENPKKVNYFLQVPKSIV